MPSATLSSSLDTALLPQTREAGLPAIKSSLISGLGMAVPQRSVTNYELEPLVETNHEWIMSRTGIAARRVAAPDESTADLAEAAARAALQHAGLAAAELDLIIVATCSGDFLFPSTACLVQDRLGARCAAFDLAAACSGFVYGLGVAHQFVATGMARHALVIGAEIMTRVLDWNDRSTCVLFGDGAGAVVLSAAPYGTGLLGFDLGSDGSGGDLLKIPVTGQPVQKAAAVAEVEPIAVDRLNPDPLPRHVHQNGREVYRFAVNVMGESALRAVQAAGLEPEDIDLFVPHQANTRIIDAAAKRLQLPPEKVFANVERYGNTSAASIPIALCEAHQQGRLKPGDHLVMVGFGGGLTWASCAAQWTIDQP